MMSVLKPKNPQETPQYLLSARKDVMKDLAKSDKVYQKIYKKLYHRQELHVMTGTPDFTDWENQVNPAVEAALKTAEAK